MTLEDAKAQGFTIACYADCDVADLRLMIKPDTDLDSRFIAWDCDADEMIKVSGWLFSVELI